jgi:hypothetical protein
MVFREVVLAAAEAAGNEVGRDGHVGYLTEVALKCPSTFVPLFARAMPQQLEPEQTSPPEDETVLHSGEDMCEHLRQQGIPPDSFVRALLKGMTPDEREHVRNGWSNVIDSDHRVEDDASDDSTGEG